MSSFILVCLPLLRLWHLRCLSQSRCLLWRSLLPCNLQINPYVKFFCRAFFKKRPVLPVCRDLKEFHKQARVKKILPVNVYFH